MTEHSAIWPNGQPAVGDTAERSRAITSHDIELFTELSGDRNPIHYDPEVAAATSFGEIVVQGGITTAILNAVVAEDLPGPGTVFLNQNWNFTAPVYIGDTITAEAEVTKVHASKPVTTLAVKVTRQNSEIVLEGKAICYTFSG